MQTHNYKMSVCTCQVTKAKPEHNSISGIPFVRVTNPGLQTQGIGSGCLLAPWGRLGSGCLLTVTFSCVWYQSVCLGFVQDDIG